MAYRTFTISVIFQLILILSILFCIAFLFFILEPRQYIYTLAVLTGALSVAVFFLIRFISRTNLELSGFIDAIKQEDFSLNYPTAQKRSSMAELHQSFNTIIGILKGIKTEREMQFNFLQLIIDNISTGILALNENQEIVLMNSAAEKLLGVHQCKTWQQLRFKAADFCTDAESLFSGGKKLIELQGQTEKVNLSVGLINTRLLDRAHRLLTINDIRNEIEQKELDAWIRLIRVLNHEIMNSTTPISSLTETILMLLEDDRKQQKPISDLNEDVIADVISSVKTIHLRSNGLYAFVNEYRKLTRVPPPKPEIVRIQDFFDNIFKFMQPSISLNGVAFSMKTVPEDLNILMDPNLIEQVMINIIKNAIEALDDTGDREIRIEAGTSHGHPFISVTDNGPGIEPELVRDVFVPFFSTKEKGSGIGLSLSRQIMRMHGGSISVRSLPNISTTFTLTFVS